MAKMTLNDLKALYKPIIRRTEADPDLRGHPNKFTRATAKGHIHEVRETARPRRAKMQPPPINPKVKKRRGFWGLFRR